MSQRLFLSVLCCIATGCVGTLLRPLDWKPFPTFEPPPVAELVAHPPATLLQGEVAPWDGVLLDVDDLNAILTDREQLLDAIRLVYAGRVEDRDYATEVTATCQTAVKVCRENQPRVFVAGMGAGAGACGVVVVGVAGATR